MELFFDIIRIIGNILDVAIIGFLIILTRRYSELRDEVKSISRQRYFKEKDRTDHRNMVNTDGAPNPYALFDFIEDLRKLLPLYKVDYSEAYGEHCLKIYPIGAHPDSGTQFLFPSFNDDIVEKIKGGLIKCNYLKPNE